ncbi:MAG TPA: hypothetical protein VFD00_07740, partial [Thermoclostridium sp.]|nr:hypothetical protein [Thermoclostridium sp.]
TGPGAYMGTALDTTIYGIVLGVVWFVCISCSPWQASRHLMAKNEQVVQRSGLISTLIILIT